MTYQIERKQITSNIIGIIEGNKEGGYSLLIYKDNGTPFISCSDVIKQGYYGNSKTAHNTLMRYRRMIENELYRI